MIKIISQELLYLYGFVLEDNPDDYLMVRKRGTSMGSCHAFVNLFAELYVLTLFIALKLHLSFAHFMFGSVFC